MQEWSRKKRVTVGLVALAGAFLVLMISPVGTGLLEDCACDSAPADWAASLQLGVADFYGMTMRPDGQREACERFLKAFTNHPRRAYARLRIANSLESDTNMSKAPALAAYEAFFDEITAHPETEQDPDLPAYKAEAEKALARIRPR